LMFYFNRNPGLSLPLIALQYHEVKITMDFRNANELIVVLNPDGTRKTASNTTSISNSANVSLTQAVLYVDYVYLDTDERRRMAQMAHEYLIDQLQNTGAEGITFGNTSQYKSRLNINHPVKELVWTLQRQINGTVGTAYNDWFNYSAADPGAVDLSSAVDLLAASKIQLNGHDRFSTRPQTYFRLVQPWQTHTRIPTNFVYLYSFALRPEEHQPSSTCNFSRIDNAQLILDPTNPANIPNYATWATLAGLSYNDGNLTIFATNYNVLRVMSGMAGLAYSN